MFFSHRLTIFVDSMDAYHTVSVIAICSCFEVHEGVIDHHCIPSK